jgi:hypothetical protein
LFDSLRAAVEYNPEMKAKAKTDLEFGKYFNDQRFTSIVN